MKYQIKVALLVLVLPMISLAETNIFSRNLKFGMSGDDVRVLQVMLNTDPTTRVAENGPGAPGSETNYFGGATRQAVIKFQEKYRAEVLIPSGLSYGTGYFGEKTRAQMSIFGTQGGETTIGAVSTAGNGAPVPTNDFASSTNIGTGIAPTPTPTPIQQTEVAIASLSQLSGKPLTQITVSGWGFTPTGNTVSFGSTTITNLNSLDGYNISLSVPSISMGVYPIAVKNAIGESKTKTYFVVVSGFIQGPTIQSITPDHATRGDTVTIKGINFSPSNNLIRVNNEVIENVPSSDGKTLTFVLPIQMLAGFGSKQTGEKVSLPVWVHVFSWNGVSNSLSFIGDF